MSARDEDGWVHGLAQIDALGPPWRSLGPGQGAARTLVELDAASGLRGPLRRAVGEGLARIAASIRRNFPQNLYCDLDALGASLAEAGQAGGAPAATARADAIAALHDAYGHATQIQFRYVHDFLYGFDWARWVEADPSTRAGVGPYEPAFLEHLARRASELTALIAAGDAKYGPLARGVDRNPFGFARDPEAEVRLLEALAHDGWVPLPAWRADAVPRWDRPFAAERRRRAAAMGLVPPGGR